MNIFLQLNALFVKQQLKIDPHLLLCKGDKIDSGKVNFEQSSVDEGNYGRPDDEKLNEIFEHLGNNLPSMFIKPMNYSVYSPKLIFEDNIRGRRTV